MTRRERSVSLGYCPLHVFHSSLSRSLSQACRDQTHSHLQNLEILIRLSPGLVTPRRSGVNSEGAPERVMSYFTSTFWQCFCLLRKPCALLLFIFLFSVFPPLIEVIFLFALVNVLVTLHLLNPPLCLCKYEHCKRFTHTQNFTFHTMQCLLFL